MKNELLPETGQPGSGDFRVRVGGLPSALAAALNQFQVLLRQRAGWRGKQDGWTAEAPTSYRYARKDNDLTDQ